jgi:hypothetical protein
MMALKNSDKFAAETTCQEKALSFRSGSQDLEIVERRI